MFTLHIMKSKCPIVKFYKPFLVHVTNMSYLDILSMTSCLYEYVSIEGNLPECKIGYCQL